jgi:hypothetical protein
VSGAGALNRRGAIGSIKDAHLEPEDGMPLDRIPSTTRRVETNTRESINRRNRWRLRENVERCSALGPAAIDERIAALEREWDIERALEANAATAALIGLGLGAFVDRRWFALPGVVAAFLLQHAVQGWCPPVPVMRRLGVRTQAEIHEELTALRILRGDFRPTREPAEAVRQTLSAARRA